MRHELEQQLLTHVSHETLNALRNYVSLLLKWQKRINLIGPGTEEDVWSRHIMDSLQLLPQLASGQKILDIGSGGGMPAVMIAAAMFHVELVESDQRKAIFLREALRVVNAVPSCVVHQRRVEQCFSPSAFDVVTARGCAPLATLLPWVFPYMKEDAFCLFLKGKNWSTEVEQANIDWHFEWEAIPSITDSESRILRIWHLQQRLGYGSETKHST